MIVQFTFGNVFSFREKNIISFQPEGLKELRHHLHDPLLSYPNEELLKSLAIYGHNSHGKSNLIKALLFFREYVKTSFSQPNLYKVEPFLLNTFTENEPSFFEILFYINDVKYRYGFEIKSNKIISEGLYYAALGVRENHLFQRVEQEFSISKTWNKENGNKLEVQAIPFTKENVLLLSVLKAQDLPLIKQITEKITEIIIVNEINAEVIEKAVNIFIQPIYQQLILSFIKNADLGFSTIFDKIETKIKTSKFEKDILNIWYGDEIRRFELYTRHQVYDKNNNEVKFMSFEMLKKESDGSIKFFILASLLVFAITHNHFICIDELDSKLHADLLEFLLKEYHSPEINLSTSQLIFTTHNTILLDRKLRRDQFVVIEKNLRGESKLRRLHTKDTPIRIDTSIEKEYRKGELGGVSKKLNAKNKNQGNLFD